MTAPYWSDGAVSLYLGDCREVLPALGVRADCVVADPPYGETSLAWDRWPPGWLDAAAGVTSSLWCFGSLRMFMAQTRRDEFARWKLSQDVIWQKTLVTSMASDRFARTHEIAAHWYQGAWSDLYRQVPRVAWEGRSAHATTRGNSDNSHLAEAGKIAYVETRTRLMESVIRCRSMFKRSIHPTEKPVGILDPMITYACPPGGLVIDPFAGSGSTLDAARCIGRRAIGIELHEPYAEKAARRLSQMTLETA